MSPHIGAHADAPLHYANGAQAIGAVALEPFLGPCRVIHAIDCGPLIQIEHIAHAAGGLPPRVLVRTAKHAAQDWWTDDFSAYAPQTIEWLAERGVMLIGLDTPSIDPRPARPWTAITPSCGTTSGYWRTWCSTTCRRAITS